MDPSHEDSPMLDKRTREVVIVTGAKNECLVDMTEKAEDGDRNKMTVGTIKVERAAMNQEEFHQMFNFKPKKLGIFNQWYYHHGNSIGCFKGMSNRSKNWCLEKCPNSFLEVFLKLIPIFDWLPKYKWREDLVGDCISGFTVAVLHVPQGLAYAMLAQIDAISGIYTAFFPVLVYILLGSSRHLSMGTFAVISILVSKPVIEICSNGKNLTETTATNATDIFTNTSEINYTSNIGCEMRVTLAVTFLTGLIQLTMGILRMGVLASLLSESLISGFTVGAAVHVVTTQIPHLLGFRIEKFTGPGRLIKCFKAIFEKLGNMNHVAIGISVTCIFILILFEFVIKPLASKKCRFPIPIQFALVVLGTLVAWALNLNEEYGLRVVGNVPVGMPSPYVPFFDVDLLKLVFLDSLGIAIISYVISLSMARIVALKLKYSVDANQELIAQGVSNLFGSFFQSLPMAASLSRTMVQVATGGKTQLASAVSTILLLAVILFVGPYFYHLPRAVLSAIILVALFGIFLQVRDLFRYVKRSCSEAFVWLATFLATVFLDVDLGLLVGLVVSLLFLIAWGYFPKIEVIRRTEYQDLFLQEDSFENNGNSSDSVAIRISGNLNLANVTSITSKIDSTLNEHFPNHAWLDGKIKNLILDLSSVTHVDTVACQDIVGIYNHFTELGLQLKYVGVRADVWTRFSSCLVFDSLPKSCFYPSLQDAFHSTQSKL